MIRIGRGSSQRLSSFIAIARRADWSLPRARKRTVWEKLQAQRSATNSRTSPEKARGLWGLRPSRLTLAFRCLTLATTLGAVLVGAKVVMQQAGHRAWHHELLLSSAGDDAVQTLGDLQGNGDVTFSDGTRLRMVETSQVVIEAVSSQGAEIRLVRGSIDADVYHRPHAHWVFGAGPYRVEVKGTSFRLDWQPKDARMTLNMLSGVVVVRGGTLRESLTVSAGESVVLNGADQAPAAEATPPHDEPSSIGAASAPAAPVVSGDASHASAGVGVVRKHGRDRRAHRDLALAKETWPGLLARGSFAEIVAQAYQRGIETVLAHGTDTDLAAFADAARYTRQNQLARRGLMALRARFPGSERARIGAFFLGRLGEATDGQVDTALAWYDRYLLESPSGAYAEGAMGREMVLLRQYKSRAQASAMAERYLASYPDGTYREMALRLSGVDIR